MELEKLCCLQCHNASDIRHRWYCGNQDCYLYVCFDCVDHIEEHLLVTGEITLCHECIEKGDMNIEDLEN